MNTVELLQGDQWLGHPAHPAFVSLPIGMWAFGLMMDTAAAFTGNECAQEAADTAVTVGLVGAGLSAMTGLSEFIRVPAERRPLQIAVTHAALNIGSVALFSLNAIIRNGRRGAGRPGGFLPKLLTMIGVGMISYGGWLGGRLAFNYGVGASVEGGTGEAEQRSAAERARERRGKERALETEHEAKARV